MNCASKDCGRTATVDRFGQWWCDSHAPIHDAVEHPAHYNFGGIEVIDAIEAWGLGFHTGNAVKYIARAKHKGAEAQDTAKALWYLNRHLKNLGG
jgi:Protein of unknwon function (DUF3310)